VGFLALSSAANSVDDKSIEVFFYRTFFVLCDVCLVSGFTGLRIGDLAV